MEATGSKHTDLTDIQLVALAKDDDQTAFFSLLQRYKDALLAHVLKFVPVVADAEDICQRSFEKAFVNIARYNSAYAFSTWLYNIARNEAIDHIRRSKTSISAISISDDASAIDVLTLDTPEEQIIVDQAVNQLNECIGKLQDNYKVVAQLRFVKDYSYEDIAEELSIPIGTVKTRINRARRALVEMLEENKRNL